MVKCEHEIAYFRIDSLQDVHPILVAAEEFNQLIILLLCEWQGVEDGCDVGKSWEELRVTISGVLRDTSSLHIRRQRNAPDECTRD